MSKPKRFINWLQNRLGKSTDEVKEMVSKQIFNDLLSFSTGGRIDKPTLALVGNASRLGDENKEWIFRDEQCNKPYKWLLQPITNP